MPRNMSFAMTTDQIRARTKTVTRRFGWWFLKPGDDLWAVKKAMGLSKGERIQRVCMIRVVSTRSEPLEAITQGDLVREGFPGIKPAEFVEMLCKHYKCSPGDLVNRIEFSYI